MRRIEQECPLHEEVVMDPRRHATSQALPEEEAAVDELFEGVPEREVEVIPVVGRRADTVEKLAGRDGGVDGVRVGDVLAHEFWEPRVEDQLWTLRALFPHEHSVDTFSALYGCKRLQFTAQRPVGEGVRLEASWARALTPERIAAIQPNGFAACHKSDSERRVVGVQRVDQRLNTCQYESSRAGTHD